MKRALAIVFLAAAACATTSQQGPQTASAAGSGSGTDDGSGSGSGMICRPAANTGSLIQREECVPAEDAKLQHDETERYMEKPRAMTTMGR
ncbi:MAG TPA: hypothetical protein VLX92_26530 [Kofleriaceae bacterium]|nr:hypothetical protein [Kofleriaceae bacterium]